MARVCGECKHFLQGSSDAASNEGYCDAFVDEDGVGKMVNVYDKKTAAKCPYFEEMERLTVDLQQDSYSQVQRLQRGFDEK
jgi:hypothetical protein